MLVWVSMRECLVWVSLLLMMTNMSKPWYMIPLSLSIICSIKALSCEEKLVARIKSLECEIANRKEVSQWKR